MMDGPLASINNATLQLFPSLFTAAHFCSSMVKLAKTPYLSTVLDTPPLFYIGRGSDKTNNRVRLGQ